MNQSPDYIADWGLEAEPIYVTDLDRCLPSDALTARPSRGRWRTMPFETQDFSGTLIAAGTETGSRRCDLSPRRAGVARRIHRPPRPIRPRDSLGGQRRRPRSHPRGVKLNGDKAFTNLTIVPDGHLKRMNLEGALLEDRRPDRTAGRLPPGIPAGGSRRRAGLRRVLSGPHRLHQAGPPLGGRGGRPAGRPQGQLAQAPVCP